ncbi:MAG: histidine phosphatase family protein [Parachlamydiales bacterium]|jgi:phosphohistidine phosphatase
MELFLMRHGLANTIDVDLEEGLTEDGIQTIKKSARALKKININFDVILCSPKKRSIQSAEIIAHEFLFPIEMMIQTDKILPQVPAEETLEFLKSLGKGYKSFFISGHMPSIKEIISLLLFPTSDLEFDIQNGGCTKIETDDHQSFLKWHLPYDVLKLIK